MKRVSIFLFLIVLFATANVQSQTSTGTGTAATGPSYSALENKLKKSDADIQDPKKNTKAATWTNRAQTLLDVYNVLNDKISAGMDASLTKAIMGNPKEIQTMTEGGSNVEIYVYDRANLKLVNGKLDSWTETKKIHEDPLNEAIKALNEAVKVNTDGKADKDIVKVADNLKIALATLGAGEYEKKAFKSSYDAFARILEIGQLPQMKNTIDTLYMYYAGRAALDNKDYSLANKNFELAASYNFEDPFFYVVRKQAYFGSGDTAAGVKVIRDGFTKYPENQNIMIEMINYYLVSKQSEEALKMLAVAKAGDPTNVSYTFTEATIYDNLGKAEQAEALYKEAIKIQPDYFDANYNLGAFYYNKAVKIYEAASKISDNAEFEKMQMQGNDELKLAIPYLERASEIDPTDKTTLDSLRQIYYRLKMDDKLNEVKAKLEKL
jgi:tetratricopeptide (TPR) repeat protein